MTARSLSQRFEAKVDRSGWPRACHEWTAGRLQGKGYGRITVNGKGAYAHRVAYELSIGPIPDGLCVLHRCDNPPCVNPLHLFVGTDADNMADRDRKGRHVSHPGSSHHNAKLTEDQVREIRSLAGTGTVQEIGKMFGVAGSTVSRIVTRKRWKSLAD